MRAARARITFERFLVDVLGHAPTPAQRVWLRVAIDGAQPADLNVDERELACTILGGVEHVPDAARHVVALLKGARVGGTWLCSLALLWLGLTTDLSSLAPGERGYGAIVAPDLRLAKQALRYIRGEVRRHPRMAMLVVAEATDALTVRREDGHEVVFVALPASRGGTASRGRTFFGALLDESSFLRDGDAVVNDAEIFRSLVVRVRPGGALFLISTAWMESGRLWELVQENHGKPSSAIAAVLPTELARPDDPAILRAVADERERDPENAAREFDCVPFGGGVSEFFDGPSLAHAADVEPFFSALREKQRSSLSLYAGADFAFRSDRSALVIVARHRRSGMLELVHWQTATPRKGQPLVPSEVCGMFAASLRRLGVRKVVADLHYSESVKESMRKHSVVVATGPGGQRGKVESYTTVRDTLREGRVHVPARAGELVRELRAVTAKPTGGGGLRISSPRVRGRGHGDLASAFVLAAWAADTGRRSVGIVEGYR